MLFLYIYYPAIQYPRPSCLFTAQPQWQGRDTSQFQWLLHCTKNTRALFCDLCVLKTFKDMSHGGRNECRIYVGNLPPDIRTKDIQDLFYKFGKVTFVDLKNRRGPPFAFVEFDDPR